MMTKNTPTVFLKYGGGAITIIGLLGLFSVLGENWKIAPAEHELRSILGIAMIISGLTLTAKMQRTGTLIISFALLITLLTLGLYGLVTGELKGPLDFAFLTAITAWGLFVGLKKPDWITPSSDLSEISRRGVEN
jgi:hypothetical protein